MKHPTVGLKKRPRLVYCSPCKFSAKTLDAIERENPAYSLIIKRVVEDALNSESLERIEKGGVRDWLESILG
jgi:hypothetical protein